MAADVATGATLTFASGLFANLTSIQFSGFSRKSIPTSHLLTTSADTFVPSDRYDPGELKLDMQWQPDTNTAVISQMAAGSTTITVTFPAPAGRSVGATLAGTGFLQNLEFTVADEELMTASATLKYSGTVSITTST